MKLNFCTALLTAATILAPLSTMAEKAQDPAAAKRAAVAAFAKLPLSFEPTESSARFVARSGNYSVSVGAHESSVVIADAKSSKHQTLHFAFENANAAAPLQAIEPLPGVTNYYLGRDSSKWRLGVKSYGKLRAERVYPGVDVIYYGDHRRLEFDFMVAPKADPTAIALSFSGMDKLYKDAGGDLVAEVGGKPVRFAKPYAYQNVGGKSKTVAADYELAEGGKVRLHIGEYDHNTELIVDPVVSYATYLGGNAFDAGNAIAVDSTGNAYVTGETCSGTDFPDTNPGGLSGFEGHCDAFVTKYTSDGTGYIYSAILGGSTPSDSVASGNGIALDAFNNVYIVGTTQITDMPGTLPYNQPPTNPNSYQGGDSDAFIVILAAGGNSPGALGAIPGELVRSTYLGGSGPDSGLSIGVDQANPANVTVVGQTCSDDFPAYNAFETKVEWCVAFMTKLDNNLDIGSKIDGTIDPLASALTPLASSGGKTYYFSGFYGGQSVPPFPSASSSSWYAWQPNTPYPQGAIVLDNQATPHIEIAMNAGVSGPYVPATSTIALPIPNWNVNLLGTTIEGRITWEDYGTPVSARPPNISEAYGVAVDRSGDVLVAGGTDTPDLGSPNWGCHASGTGAWVLKVHGDRIGCIYEWTLETTPTDKSLTYNTARAIAVDAQNRAYVVGTTGTAPATTGALGVSHAFLLRVNEVGSGIDYYLNFGGSGQDQGLGVAVDGNFSPYVTGSTTSKDFPTVNPLVNPSTSNLMNTLSGSMDAFISEYSADGSAMIFSSYLGGSDIDQGNAIAVDQSSGDMYLAGYTSSTDLEQLNPSGYIAPQTYGGATDALVAKIAASGANIAGLATISLPASLPFPPQTVKTSATLPVTLSNSSTTGAVLTISQILPSPPAGSKKATVGDFTMDYTACPLSLAAGASCQIFVTFLPTSATSESASLSVSGSATNSPQTVNITGTGVPVGSGSGSGSGSNGSSDFNLAMSSTALSINQGGTAVYYFAVTPINGYKGSVAFTCSGPAGSSYSVSTNPLTMDGITTKNVTLSVNTTGGNGSMSSLRPGARSIFLALLPFSMMGMLLINKRRGGWLGLLLVALCLLLGSMSCGTNSGSSSGKLAPGTYQVNLTATSSATPASAQTVALSLVVNPQ